MNSLSNAVALLLVNIFHGVVVDGGDVTDPINTCKSQPGLRYETVWSEDMNGAQGCAKDCLNYLLSIQAHLVTWEGCFHRTSCNLLCSCTVDSYPVAQGYTYFVNSMRFIRLATEQYLSVWGERYEGVMYVAYDCRPSNLTGSESKSMRGYKSKTGRDYNSEGRQHSSKRSRMAYWR